MPASRLAFPTAAFLWLCSGPSWADEPPPSGGALAWSCTTDQEAGFDQGATPDTPWALKRFKADQRYLLRRIDPSRDGVVTYALPDATWAFVSEVNNQPQAGCRIRPLPLPGMPAFFTCKDLSASETYVDVETGRFQVYRVGGYVADHGNTNSVVIEIGCCTALK